MRTEKFGMYPDQEFYSGGCYEDNNSSRNDISMRDTDTFAENSMDVCSLCINRTN